MNAENNISTAKNFLININKKEQNSAGFDDLLTRFCGQVINFFSEIKANSSPIRVYVVGDIIPLKQI